MFALPHTLPLSLRRASPISLSLLRASPPPLSPPSSQLQKLSSASISGYASQDCVRKFDPFIYKGVIVMECLKTNFIRNSGPVHDFTLPSIEKPDRLCVKPRRLACSRLCSPSSQECRTYFSMICPVQPSFHRHKSRAAAGAASQISSVPEGADMSDPNETVPRKLSSDQLNNLLLDTERTKILKKLSEANQYNRFLQRQLLKEQDATTKFKSELAVMELELVALVGLAEEIANSRIPPASRKIKGKYIQSHLLARLQVIHGKVKEQIKDIDCLKFENVTLFWIGMAESVQVMGSFDGWTKGVEMSPEYEGDYGSFSATLKLRPGRYEIKFLVDGNWLLSSKLPTVGEEIQNNLLVVEHQAN